VFAGADWRGFGSMAANRHRDLLDAALQHRLVEVPVARLATSTQPRPISKFETNQRLVDNS
jgi:hypothetical protein